MSAVAAVAVVLLTLAGPPSAPRLAGNTVGRRVAPCRAPLPLLRKSPKLQAALERGISKARLGKYLKRHKLSVAVVDLTDDDRVSYAGLNDNTMMYAASVPKIAALLSVVSAVEAGKLTWSDEMQTRLSSMIVHSSNEDASWAVDQVGLAAIESTMRDARYCLYDDTYGGLWIGRAFRSGGEVNRDPHFDITHGATARQAARFYAMLARGALVTPAWSERLLGLMAPPMLHHKFVAALEKRPGLTFLARKSGSWRTYHADSALIEHNGRRYAVTALADSKHGEELMRAVAEIADDAVLRTSPSRTLASAAWVH
ncbi:MAG: serine hydrolase [Myxococcota bacterium]